MIITPLDSWYIYKPKKKRHLYACMCIHAEGDICIYSERPQSFSRRARKAFLDVQSDCFEKYFFLLLVEHFKYIYAKHTAQNTILGRLIEESF